MKIESIKIIHTIDEDPDFSHLGEYTDDLKPGVIVRCCNEYYENLPDDFAYSFHGSEFQGFKPLGGDEPVGSKAYREYGMQDFKRIEGYNNNDWFYICISAKATVSYSINNEDLRFETLSSGGIWGVETDGGEDFIKEIETEELNDLKDHLKQFGIDVSNFDSIEVEHP